MTETQINAFIISCIALLAGYAFGRFSGYDHGFRTGYVSGMRAGIRGVFNAEIGK